MRVCVRDGHNPFKKRAAEQAFWKTFKYGIVSGIISGVFSGIVTGLVLNYLLKKQP